MITSLMKTTGACSRCRRRCNPQYEVCFTCKCATIPGFREAVDRKRALKQMQQFRGGETIHLKDTRGFCSWCGEPCEKQSSIHFQCQYDTDPYFRAQVEREREERKPKPKPLLNNRERNPVRTMSAYTSRKLGRSLSVDRFGNVLMENERP